MLLYSCGDKEASLSAEDLRAGLFAALEKLGGRGKVLAIPPDFTRYHSRAGVLTEMCLDYYGERLTDILPATGTHFPMSAVQIEQMFGRVPAGLFREHNWRRDLETLGRVPAEYVRRESGGRVDYDWPAQVNALVVSGGFDLIVSIGQVVPHEVIGMANYNKNIFVGTGGVEGINKSHYLGAVCGIERIMGRPDNPVRRVLNYASEHFARELPVVYVHTVVATGADGGTAVRGLFIGDDIECFNRAAELSLEVNFRMLDKPLEKVVVYLDPGEYKSTWLGNKSIYRTRMAMADGGELIVLAPGVGEFGEDGEIDKLIRKYGYFGTERTVELVAREEDLRANLGAAAHLIHGSSEGRFAVTYCAGGLTREAIESVGFGYGELSAMLEKYNPERLRDGPNTTGDGEEVYFISNPALGLWSSRDRFSSSGGSVGGGWGAR